ncbi:MAG: branched-chain amino acid ABC transporter permease [bacterium]
MPLITQILQYCFTGLTIGSIFAMVGLGFNIIYNATDIINFAQGEFVMIGGMIMISLTKGLRIPMIPAFFFTIIIVAIIGILLERLAISPLSNPSIITLIIITIGASIVFKGLAMLVWGKDTFILPAFTGEKPIIVGGAVIIPQSLWVLGITLLVVIGLAIFFEKTLTGKAMRACATNSKAASLMGISVKHMVMLSFALSAAIGAVAGVIITPISLMEYQRGTMLAIKGFAAAILGGLGSGAGAVIAGFLIGIMESMGAGFISSGYKDAIALVVLLLVLFFKPTGIMGRSELR